LNSSINVLQTTEPENEGDAVLAQPPSIAQNLLSDYVAMGLIQDPAAPTPQQLYNEENEGTAPPPELPRVPWLHALKGISSPFLRLHQEIVEFSRFVAPSPEEETARRDSIARIQSVVQSIWPVASLEVFGSFATGLYLPTSDLDAVILNSGCTDIPSGLKALANALTRRNLAKNMQVISKARVPIIKFEESESGYAFDISFDVANGPEAAANVRALMDSLPPMRPLVTVIKVFLQQRELNEVYSGGLGSYAVLVLVASFLQMHPSRLVNSGSGAGDDTITKKKRKKKRNKASVEEQQQNEDIAPPFESNLGILLVDFFRLYGRALNHTSVGVSCRKGGGYFSKRSKGFYNDERSYLLAIEDPNEPDNDLGKNSFNASRARAAFDYAYCRLTAQSGPGESLLHRIIRLDSALFLREPMPHPPEVENKVKRKEVVDEERKPIKQPPPQQQQQQQQQSGGERKAKRQHRERSVSEEEDVWIEEERRPAKRQDKGKNKFKNNVGGGGGGQRGGGKSGGHGKRGGGRGGGGGWNRGRDNNKNSSKGKFKSHRPL
jgi:non-canonical poly(A) RNA polymerase PAPD5/7